jgi:hypothetical protein
VANSISEDSRSKSSARGVNLGTFQEDFDLGQNNSFDSVSAKIRSVYPTPNIEVESFARG